MWDERYQRDDYLFGTEPNAFLVRSACHLPKTGSVLAVADGEGRNGAWLAARGLDVTAVDGSAVALAKARRLAAQRGVSLRTVHADLLDWAWPEAAFDAVVAIFIQFTGPADRRRMFDDMTRALKPGGVLLLEGYRPEQLRYGTGGPPVADNLYTEEQLRADLPALHIDSIRSYDAEIHEGTGHSGMSALIDLVAHKP